VPEIFYIVKFLDLEYRLQLTVSAFRHNEIFELSNFIDGFAVQ
jgi:hypothetical protein